MRKTANYTIVKHWQRYNLLFNTDMTALEIQTRVKVSQNGHIYEPCQEFQKIWQQGGKSEWEDGIPRAWGITHFGISKGNGGLK